MTFQREQMKWGNFQTHYQLNTERAQKEKETKERESDEDAKPVCLLVCSDEMSFL